MTDLRIVGQSDRHIGTILHIGPGRGGVVDACFSAKPDRLILVEADAQAMPALSRKIAEEVSGSGPKVQVLQTALVAAYVDTPVYLYLAGSGPFASLCAPAPDLLKIYPGLFKRTPAPVAVIDPPTLKAFIDLAEGPSPSCMDPDHEDILILQSPGQAAGLLEAFDAAGLLHKYARIYLSEPDSTYYTGAQTLEEAQTILSLRGYTCEILKTQTRMGWPWLLATLNFEEQTALIKRAHDAKVEQLSRTKVDIAPSAHLLARIASSMDQLNNAVDPLSFIAEEVKGYKGSERVHLAFTLYDHYVAQNNRLMALDSLAEARESLPAASYALRNVIARRYFDLGETWLALDTLRPDNFEEVAGTFTPDERKKMQDTFEEGVPQSLEHGHSLLLAHLEKILPQKGIKIDGLAPVLIEVGTTRERVPGQGSTAKIASFCKERGIHMITVDMDPRNGVLARELFARLETNFEAVTDKGEDFLAAYQKPIDYVFLDAYDFDHGKHSELRQSRYEAFLGNRIDEEDCHRMHLECAEALVDILSPDGVICIDDTWLDEAGAWTAKGTLAVPFLLGAGFEIIEARNRAILMTRAAPKA